MSLRAQWIAGALGLVLAACDEDRVAGLRAQIQRLEAERVEAPAVERARLEADEAQRETERLRASLADTRAALGAAAREGVVLSREAATEQAAAARLREAAAAVLAEAQRELDALPGLDARITAAQARAEVVRRQADVLLSELRPGDPAWATERRLRTLTELAERVARENPDDPVLASVAATLRAQGASPAPNATSPAVQAARLRDRMQRVFDLPPPTTTTSPSASRRTRRRRLPGPP